MILTGSLLAYLGVPKNDSGLEILLVLYALYEEKMYPVHKPNKQTN